MTPKEKAKELFEKMKLCLFSDGDYDAKQCALIAVEEILNAIDWHEFEVPNKEITYWQEVKNEIEKL
jgi:hypothetical protein